MAKNETIFKGRKLDTMIYRHQTQCDADLPEFDYPDGADFEWPCAEDLGPNEEGLCKDMTFSELCKDLNNAEAVLKMALLHIHYRKSELTSV